MAIGDTITTGTFSIAMGKFTVETAQDVSDLKLDQDVVEIKQVTSSGQPVTHKQPGVEQRGEVTITRGLDRSAQFTKWIEKTRTRGVDSATPNITITVMDTQRKPVRRIRLHNAWASSWTGPSLEAGKGPATERVTISFEDAEIEST